MGRLIMWNQVTLGGRFEGEKRPDLSRTRMDQGLFDECRFVLVPVVPGAGKPLFAPGRRRPRLRLLEARPLDSGCVVLHHEPLAAR